jgi:hypothetical protein
MTEGLWTRLVACIRGRRRAEHTEFWCETYLGVDRWNDVQEDYQEIGWE